MPEKEAGITLKHRAMIDQAWAEGEEWARGMSLKVLADLLDELAEDDSQKSLRRIAQVSERADVVCRLAMLGLQEIVYRTRPIKDGGGAE